MLFRSGIYPRSPAIWLSLLVVLVTGCASAPDSVEISEVEEIAAAVTAIDQARRLVTIRGPQGNELTFEAGPEVRNLAQVQVGDIVRLTYEQTYIATRTDAEEVSASVPVAVGAARAEPGERPGGAVGAVVAMTVRVRVRGPRWRYGHVQSPGRTTTGDLCATGGVPGVCSIASPGGYRRTGVR